MGNQQSTPSAESMFSTLLDYGFDLRTAQRIFRGTQSNPEFCREALSWIWTALEAVVRRRGMGTDLRDPRIHRPANTVLNYVANCALCELGEESAQDRGDFTPPVRNLFLTLQTMGIPFPEVSSTHALRLVMRGAWEATRYPLPEAFLRR